MENLCHLIYNQKQNGQFVLFWGKIKAKAPEKTLEKFEIPLARPLVVVGLGVVVVVGVAEQRGRTFKFIPTPQRPTPLLILM